MSQYYTSATKLLTAVDCMVFGYDIQDEQLRLLLFRRKVKPYADRWSLVGSFVNENEDIRMAAARVLEEFTGLKNVFLKQLRCFGKVNRDPGDRVLSIAYWSLIPIDEQQKYIVNLHGAKWFDIDMLPKLILDHDQMVAETLTAMRNMAQHFPIGKELLPEYFTLPQLLQLYRSIYQKDIDDRNFRKKILSSKILLKQKVKDMSSSRKGAFYFKFDKDKYEQLLESGFHFNI